MELDQHVHELNHQIDELLKKLKVSNVKNSEYATKINTLQRAISTLEHVSTNISNFRTSLLKKSYVIYLFFILFN